MKKSFVSLFILALVVLFAFAIVGCDSAAPEVPADTDGTDQEPEEQAVYTIIEAPKMVGIAWWDRSNEGNARYAQDTGHEVFQIGPTEPDAALQVSTLQDIVAQQPDIINVIPISPDSVEPILKQARDAGIVVISHEAPGLQNVDYNIEAFDNAEYGAYLMDKLAELMGEEGDFVIMVGALTMEAHMERAGGAVARWEEAYPNMNMITDVVEGLGQEASYNRMKELMTAYPTLGGVLGFDAVNVPACGLAVEEAGKTGEIKVIGTTLVSMAKPYLESGSVQLINFWDPYEVARVMSAVGVMVKEGQSIQSGDNLGVPGYEDVIVDGTVIFGKAWIDVTLDNIDEYNF